MAANNSSDDERKNSGDGSSVTSPPADFDPKERTEKLKNHEPPKSKKDIPSNHEITAEMPTLPQKKTIEYLGIALLCLLVAFGGFVFGYDTGTISGFVNMTDYKQRFGSLQLDGTSAISTIRTGLIVSLFNVGCAFGCIFLSKIADIWGRRLGIMICMVIYSVGIIIQISSTNKWYQIMIGRIITGLAVGTLSVLSPLFIGETAPKQLRGTLVCCFQLNITLGIFLGYLINYGTKLHFSDARTWRIPLGLSFLWAGLMATGMVFMPESPRFLIEKGMIEEGKKSIAKANKVDPEDPAVYTELELIQAGIDREMLAGTASWSQLITGKPKILNRVIVGTVLQSLQQLTGNNYFFYYGTSIFLAIGLSDSFQTAIILGIVNFASTFIGVWAIERFGRRMCLLTGSVCCASCFLIYSIVGSVSLYPNGYDGPTNKPSGSALIFISCFFIFFFASTWAGGVYSIISEIYPLRIRSKAMGFASAGNWMFGFLISFFTPLITAKIHFYYGFMFTGCLIFSFFFVYFMVYETKGLTLEEVDELYASGVKPWKSSGWVPPSADNMAHSTGYAAATKPETEHV